MQIDLLITKYLALGGYYQMLSPENQTPRYKISLNFDRSFGKKYMQSKVTVLPFLLHPTTNPFPLKEFLQEFYFAVSVYFPPHENGAQI